MDGIDSTGIEITTTISELKNEGMLFLGTDNSADVRVQYRETKCYRFESQFCLIAYFSSDVLTYIHVLINDKSQ